MIGKGKQLHFSAKVIIGLGLGIMAGILLQPTPDIADTFIKPWGTLYLNAIKMIMVPLVFCSLSAGVCGVGDMKKFGRIGLKIISIYLATTVLAAVIGVVLGNLTDVGKGLHLTAEAAAKTAEAPDFADTLIHIIPGNPIQAMAEGNMLQIIVFALFVGTGILRAGQKGEPVKAFIDGMAEIIFRITNSIMQFTPYAVFALIAPAIAVNGREVLLPLLAFILVVYAGLGLHVLFVYFTGIRFGIRMSPIKFIREIWGAVVVAFSTSSTSAALPAAMKCGEGLGISLPVRSFALPLGAAVNMNGGAIYQGVAAIFIANLYGIHLTISQQISIIGTAVLASLGTAGVAGASIIVLGVVLSSAGLPLEGIAIVAGIDKLIDMPRAAINITGDLMCTAIVARSEGQLEKL